MTRFSLFHPYNAGVFRQSLVMKASVRLIKISCTLVYYIAYMNFNTDRESLTQIVVEAMVWTF